MKNEKAVVYVRVSSKEQDKYSPEIQLENCHAYAKARGLKVARDFREAASGWKANARVEFYKMLEFIEEEGIVNLIYAYGDRLSRNMEDYVKLKATNVVLHNAVSGISFSPNDPEQYDQTAAFEHDQVEAKKFSAKNSHRVRGAYDQRVKEGLWPHSLPIGLKRAASELDGKIVRHIELDGARNRATLVRQMFQLFATGDYTRAQITAKMRDLGLRSKTGKPFSLSQVEDMLKDPKYTGRLFVWKGALHDWLEDCPPLVPRALFDQAQEVFQNKRRGAVKRAKDYRYKGLLTCDFCGCDIIGDRKEKILKRTGEKKTYVYYRCTSGKDTVWYREHYKSQKCPMYYGPYFTQEDVDGFFETAIENLAVDPGTYDWVKGELEEGYKNLEQLRQGEIAGHKKRLTEIETTQGLLAERAAFSKPPLQAIYERQLDNLEQEKISVKARPESLEAGKEAVSLEDIHETLELSKSLKENYLAATPEKRAKLNKLMFRTVRITKEGWIPTHDEDDECITIVPYYFVWNEPFRSLWEIGFIQGMSEATADLTEEQKAHKPRLIMRERA
jgi:DNA invertase Pin-like site-specific DNA recombinase